MPDLAGRVRRLVERVTGDGGAMEARPGEPRVGTGLEAVAEVERACGARLIRSAAVVSGDGGGGALAGREALGQAVGLALGGRRAAVLLAGGDLERCGDLLRRAADLRLPLTVHAVGGDGGSSPTAPGVVHLVAADVQEAADFAAVAHHLAESALTPVLVSMDGPGTAHALRDYLQPPADLVAAFVGAPGQQVHPRTPAQEILFGDHRPRIPRWHDPERPLLAGARLDGSSHDCPAQAAADLARERFFAPHLPDLLDEALAAWGELTGRRHRPLSAFRLRGAKLVLVTAGATVGIAEGVARHLRRHGGPKVGVLGLRGLAPLPAAAFVEALPSSARLVVLERSAADSGEDPPLATRLRGLLGRALEGTVVPAVAAVTWGGGGAPLRRRDLAELCRALDARWQSRLVLGVGPSEGEAPTPKRRAFLDQLDRAYPAPQPPSLRAPGSKPLAAGDDVFTVGVFRHGGAAGALVPELASLLHGVAGGAFRGRCAAVSGGQPAVDLLSFCSEPFSDPGDEVPLDLAVWVGGGSPPARLARRLGDLVKGGALLLAVAPEPGRGGPNLGISSPGAGPHPIFSRDDVDRWILGKPPEEQPGDAVLGAVVELLRRLGRLDATDRQLLRSRRARLESSAGAGAAEVERRLDAFQAGIAGLARQADPTRGDLSASSGDVHLPSTVRGGGSGADFSAGDLPRHWHQVASLVRQGRGDALVPDPELATGTLPARSAALQDPGRGRRLLPRWDAAACTGCGACWCVCPDGAVVPTVLGSAALLDHAKARAKGRGHAPEALRMVASRLADGADREVGEGGAAAEVFDRAFAALLPKLPLPEERKAAVREAWGPVREALGGLAVAGGEPFSADGESRLLALAIDPDACKGCGACVEVCAPEALVAAPDDRDAVADARTLSELVRTLPPPDRDALDAVAGHAEAGPLPAALLSREARSVATGGDAGEPGSGARTAVRQVLGSLALSRARHAEALTGEIAELRQGLAAEIHDGLARALPRDDLDALARRLETLSRPDAELSQLTARVEGAMGGGRVDAPRLRRLVASARHLADLEWKLAPVEDGRDGGSAPFGLVVAPGADAAWAGTFPANPFSVPVVVDATGDAPALAAGLAAGAAAEAVDRARALRLARAELERPAEAEGVEAELRELAWGDLTRDERRACPPTVVLLPEEALAGPALAELFRLLGEDLPVVVLCLAEGDLSLAPPDAVAEPARVARPLPVEPALLALAEPRALVLAASIAFPDHLAAGLAAVADHAGPAFVRLHAPSPLRHGFPVHLARARAEAAVLSRVSPLLLAQPGSARPGGTAGEAASVDLDGNPEPEEFWHDAWDPARFALGEVRFAAHFRGLADADPEPTPLTDFLSLDAGERAGRTPVVTDPSDTATPRVPSQALVAAVERTAARWRTLQGMALADRELIAAAVAEAEERTARGLTAAHERERDALITEHRARLAGVEEEVKLRAAFAVRDRLIQLAALAEDPAAGGSPGEGAAS